MLNDAVEEGIIQRSPVGGIKMLKVEKKATEIYHRREIGQSDEFLQRKIILNIYGMLI